MLNNIHHYILSYIDLMSSVLDISYFEVKKQTKNKS